MCLNSLHIQYRGLRKKKPTCETTFSNRFANYMPKCILEQIFINVYLGASFMFKSLLSSVSVIALIALPSVGTAQAFYGGGGGYAPPPPPPAPVAAPPPPVVGPLSPRPGSCRTQGGKRKKTRKKRKQPKKKHSKKGNNKKGKKTKRRSRHKSKKKLK